MAVLWVLLLFSGNASAQLAASEKDFVEALTKGRTAVIDGKRYVWQQGKVLVEVDGELRPERGVDRIVSAVTPMASANIAFTEAGTRLAASEQLDQLAAALKSLDVAVAVYVFVNENLDDQVLARKEKECSGQVVQALIDRGVPKSRIAIDPDPPMTSDGNLTVARQLE